MMTRDVGSIAQGTILYQGRYRIDLLLTRTPHRAIYRAWDLSRNRAASIVELVQADEAITTGALERAAPLVQLDHPTLHAFQVVFVEHDTVFLALTFASGQTIEHIMRDRTAPIQPQAAVRWISQVAEMLEFFAADLSDWHLGDLSSSALFVTSEDRAQPLSFELPLGLLTPERIAADLPQGAVAPELAQGRCDARSDVYSLAATLHLLLTRQAWPGGDPATQAALDDVTPALTRPLIDAVERGLARDPANRWPDVSAFHAALLTALTAPAEQTDWWATSVPPQPIHEDAATLTTSRDALRAAMDAEANARGSVPPWLASLAPTVAGIAATTPPVIDAITPAPTSEAASFTEAAPAENAAPPTEDTVASPPDAAPIAHDAGVAPTTEIAPTSSDAASTAQPEAAPAPGDADVPTEVAIAANSTEMPHAEAAPPLPEPMSDAPPAAAASAEVAPPSQAAPADEHVHEAEPGIAVPLAGAAALGGGAIIAAIESPRFRRPSQPLDATQVAPPPAQEAPPTAPEVSPPAPAPAANAARWNSASWDGTPQPLDDGTPASADLPRRDDLGASPIAAQIPRGMWGAVSPGTLDNIIAAPPYATEAHGLGDVQPLVELPSAPMDATAPAPEAPGAATPADPYATPPTEPAMETASPAAETQAQGSAFLPGAILGGAAIVGAATIAALAHHGADHSDHAEQSSPASDATPTAPAASDIVAAPFVRSHDDWLVAGPQEPTADIAQPDDAPAPAAPEAALPPPPADLPVPATAPTVAPEPSDSPAAAPVEAQDVPNGHIVPDDLGGLASDAAIIAALSGQHPSPTEPAAVPPVEQVIRAHPDRPVAPADPAPIGPPPLRPTHSPITRPLAGDANARTGSSSDTGPIPTTKTPSIPLIERLRQRLQANSVPATATGTIVVPRQMYPKNTYSVLVRLQYRSARKPGDSVPGTQQLAIVEVDAPADAFYLPVRRLALPIPVSGGLSEGSLAVTALRATPAGTDRLTFTFRLNDGTVLHKGHFVAEVTILGPQQLTSGNQMVTLVHTLDLPA
jgi:hypothetical protein